MAVVGILGASPASAPSGAAADAQTDQRSFDLASDAVRLFRDRLSASTASRRAGELAGLTGSTTNTSAAASILQIVDKALTDIDTRLTRLKELATQASSSLLEGQTKDEILSVTERAKLDTEFNRLRDEITEIVNNTQFNDADLLKGDSPATTLTLAFKVGGNTEASDTITVAIDAATVANLSTNFATAKIATSVDADAALTEVTAAISKLDSIQAAVSAGGAAIHAAAFTNGNQSSLVENQKLETSATQVSVDLSRLIAESALEDRGVSALLHDTELNRQLAVTLNTTIIRPVETDRPTPTSDNDTEPLMPIPAAPAGGTGAFLAAAASAPPTQQVDVEA